MGRTAQVCGADNLDPAAPCCPLCGKPGNRVAGKTVWSIVRGEPLLNTAEDGWCLCLSPGCDVVYFGRQVFSKNDPRVRVWFKENDPSVPVCYCKEVTAAEIFRHIQVLGCRETLEDIQKHTGANTGRDSVTRNPAGG